MSLVLLIIAIVLFLVAAFGLSVVFGNVGTVPLGLAFFAASFLPIGGIAWPTRRETPNRS